MAHRKHKGAEFRAKNKEETMYETVSSYRKLYKSHTLCRRGKRNKDDVAAFDLNAGVSVLWLHKSLRNHTYEIGAYKQFMLSERGKLRRISAAKYHARVVQRSLHENVMSPIIHKSFIMENSASQKDKGVDYARNLLKRQLTDYYHKYGHEGIVTGGILVGDIHGYFPSIDHEIVDKLYARFPLDKETLDLIIKVHQSTEYLYGKVGDPLGNEVSQTDGLLVLNPFDHIVKEKWHIPYYGRYMDDFYLIHPDMNYLKKLLAKVVEFLKNYGFELNEKKTKIIPIWQGFTYLGFKYRMSHTGKVYMRMKPQNLERHKQKIRKMGKMVEEGKMEFHTMYDSFVCHIGHMSKGDTYYLAQSRKKHFCERYEKFIIEGINEGYIKEKTSKGKPCPILPDRDCAVKKRIMKAFKEKKKHDRFAKLCEDLGIEYSDPVSTENPKTEK